MPKGWNRDDVANLEGVIVPGMWNGAGQVVAVNLATGNREELFIVADSELNEKLVADLWKRVRIAGTVFLNQDGDKLLDPTNYKIVGSLELSAS